MKHLIAPALLCASVVAHGQTGAVVLHVTAKTVPCPAKPANETQAGQCPAGTTGAWTQTVTYASAPAPACWTAGPWTPASAPAGACVTPPVTPPSTAVTYDTRIGQGADANGVPILTKHADARYIYMNPAKCNDNNTGLDPDQAKCTPAAGWAALRDGKGDWLLMAQGSTSASSFGSLTARNGRSAQYPTVVTTYDPAAPTTLRQGLVTLGTAPGSSMLDMGRNTGMRLVFENIVFDKRDNSSAAVMGLDPVQRDLMFFNVRFNRTQVSFQGDFSGNPTDANASNVVFRRCVFANSYAQGHSQGLYLWAMDGVTVEDSIFFHNGWQGTDRNAPSDPPDIFRHNAYFGTRTFNTIFRRNVSAYASANGLQMRGGGIAVDNVFASNPIGALIGGGDHYDQMRPNGVPYQFDRNVIVGSSEIDANNPRGTGAEFLNTMPGGSADRNLVVNIGPQRSPYNQVAFFPHTGFNQPTVVSWTNNIVWNWGTYSTQVYTADVGYNKFPAQLKLTMTGNVMPNDPATGTNVKAPTTPFPEPNRTIATYAKANGYASEAALWAYVIQHPEVNWAKSIGDYVRAGFGR